MKDRDTLSELFEIVSEISRSKNLTLTSSALSYVKENIGKDFDVYFRRRFSVCRMLMDFHLPLSDELLDCIIAAALCHHLPGDNIPLNYDDTLAKLFENTPLVNDILKDLRQTDYYDSSYYDNLIKNKYALIIRLTERGVLFETLYDWPTKDARNFIRQTKENFFPMCIYAKENYPEFRVTANILIEKTKTLLLANEAMLNRYETQENNLDLEILSLMEENSSLRSMISDYTELINS